MSALLSDYERGISCILSIVGCNRDSLSGLRAYQGGYFFVKGTDCAGFFYESVGFSDSAFFVVLWILPLYKGNSGEGIFLCAGTFGCRNAFDLRMPYVPLFP